MLIHPSSARSLHDAYRDWVNNSRQRIERSLDDGDEVLAAQLVDEVFAEPYRDLTSTGGTLADDGSTISLEDMVTALRDDLLGYVSVRVVNSEDGHDIAEGEWTQAPGWIVIGGNPVAGDFSPRRLVERSIVLEDYRALSGPAPSLLTGLSRERTQAIAEITSETYMTMLDGNAR